MKRIPLLVSVFVLFLIPTIASAQATRTWVSGVGDDVNPCSRTAPCKTFAGAISKTAAGGEINALDPGGYGAVTITKSITIDGSSTHASILACGTNGVIINANSTATVILRNLSINGCGNTASPGLNGIRVLLAKNVHIDNVVVFGFRSTSAGVGRGVDINTSVTDTNVTIYNSIFEDNIGAAINSTVNGVGTVNLTVDSCSIVRNGAGIDASNQTDANITRNVINHNVNNGINVANASCDVDIADNYINENNIGINVSVSGVTVRIFKNQITKNGTSMTIPAGSTIASHGLNQIALNGVNTLPNSSPGTN